MTQTGRYSMLTCHGTRRDGRRCERPLLEIEPVPGTAVRVRCRDCHALNVCEIQADGRALVRVESDRALVTMIASRV